MWQYQKTDELYHHGILGMKWGVRRYQNANGSLTTAGKQRYNKNFTNAEKVKAAKSKMDSSKSNFKTKKDEYIRRWSDSSDNAYDKAYKETYDASRKMGMGKRKSEKRAYKSGISAATTAEYKAINKYRPGVIDAKKEYKTAKKEYKKELKKTNEKYTKKARNIDRFLYNEATRNKVNKLMNQGMTMEQARSRVHKEAWRNTTIATIGIIGGYQLAKRKIL